MPRKGNPPFIKCANDECRQLLDIRLHDRQPPDDVPAERIHRYRAQTENPCSVACARCGHYTIWTREDP
jgi:hypothetical protein